MCLQNTDVFSGILCDYAGYSNPHKYIDQRNQPLPRGEDACYYMHWDIQSQTARKLLIVLSAFEPPGE
jgi:hypothetical protein